MTINNDGKLPIEYRGQKYQGKDRDEGSIISNQERIWRQQQGEQVSQPSFVRQLINAVGPDLTIPGQHDGSQIMGSYQGQQQGTHPALFGQNQLKNDLDPVYAIPSFPSQNSHLLGTGHTQWQQWGSHHQAMTPYCWCYPCCYWNHPFEHR